MGSKKHHHETPARESRRALFTEPRRRPAVSWNAIIIAAALLFVGIAILSVAMRSGGPGAAAASTGLPAGADVRLPVSLFDDGEARFYRYTSSGNREIRFFVLKSSDGVIRAAFDACDVCYAERRGYRQAGDFMVCNNCNQQFRSVDVNVLRGGCNPAPIERYVEGGEVVLTAVALEAGAFYF